MHLPARPFLCLALARLTHSAIIVLMLLLVSKLVSLILPPSITKTTSSMVMLWGEREGEEGGGKKKTKSDRKKTSKTHTHTQSFRSKNKTFALQWVYSKFSGVTWGECRRVCVWGSVNALTNIACHSLSLFHPNQYDSVHNESKKCMLISFKSAVCINYWGLTAIHKHTAETVLTFCFLYFTNLPESKKTNLKREWKNSLKHI